MKVTYDVRPRYTAPGVSGEVHDEALALRIVNEERKAYEEAIGGRLGPDDFARAQREGLDRIVIRKTHFTHGVKHEDAITGRLIKLVAHPRNGIDQAKPTRVTMHFARTPNGNAICSSSSTQLTLDRSQVTCDACLVKLGMKAEKGAQ